MDQSEVDGDGFYPRRIPVTTEDRELLRAFQRAIDTNGEHPLTKEQINQFIAMETDAGQLAIR